MVAIHSVSGSRVSQLEVGAYYIVKGTRHGLPITPQVLYLQEKEIHPTFLGEGHMKGILFWRMWDKVGKIENHLITLKEVNIPEHGEHDIHLERVHDHVARGVVSDPQYREVQSQLLNRRKFKI